MRGNNPQGPESKDSELSLGGEGQFLRVLVVCHREAYKGMADPRDPHQQCGQRRPTGPLGGPLARGAGA